MGSRVVAGLIMGLYFMISIDAKAGVASQTPHLKGKLTVSVKDGTIDADITISNIPKSSRYGFQLNAGLNVKGVTHPTHNTNYAYDREYQNKFYESFSYSIPGNKAAELYQPESLNWRYSGKFPVYSDNYKSRSDWKGNVAFNGMSLRADGMQTALFPIYYDANADKLYKEVTYDLQIDCADCSSLFINGSSPVRKASHRFVSNKPAEPMMYLGEFDFIEVQGNRVLNPLISAERIERGLKVVSQYKSILSTWFDKRLPSGINFVQTTPVSEKNSWLWVSGSTIVSISHDYYALDRLFVEGDARYRAHDFIAHELGHVLFNSFPGFQGELSLIIEEGVAEYLAWNLVGDVQGDGAKAYLLNWRKERLKGAALKPMSMISVEDDFFQSNLFRYNYLPLFIHNLEGHLGKEKTMHWIKSLAKEEKALNASDFLNSIESALSDEEAFHALVNAVDNDLN